MKSAVLAIALLAGGVSIPILGVTLRDIGAGLICGALGFVAGVAYVAWRETANGLADAQRHASDRTFWDGGPR